MSESGEKSSSIWAAQEAILASGGTLSNVHWISKETAERMGLTFIPSAPGGVWMRVDFGAFVGTLEVRK